MLKYKIFKMIKKTKYYSYKTGTIAKGCQLCVNGRKSVLFATGVCPRDCFYCPISNKKKNNDVVFINELQIAELDIEKLVSEIKISNSLGVGITGGDPISRTTRTAGFIKILKKRFGPNFHIHLYTSFDLINENNLKKLFDSGLDEIRFHPDLDNPKFWEKIDIAKKFKWDIGIEVPLIPDKEDELISMLYFFKDKVDFFNFNEFEVSDNNIDMFTNNYTVTTDNSYAVKGSLKLGLKLMDFCDKNNLNAHLCSVKLKDGVQLAKRIKLRSKRAKLKTDKLTHEGLLKRGVIYCNMIPEVHYESILAGISPEDKKLELEELKNLKIRLNGIFNISLNKLTIDTNKLRILTSEKIAKKLSHKIAEICAIVVEYPTADQLSMDIEIIK